MYSRNIWEDKQNNGYTLPPGYDGSRFRRRRTSRNNSTDEVVFVPDSGFTHDSATDNEEGELSVGGIPTQRGIRSDRAHSAVAEIDDISCYNETSDEYCDPCETDEPYESALECPHKNKEKLSGILSKLGFTDGLSSDELLICALIFIIASDKENGGRNAGDILLILALLLGIR